MKRVVCIGAEDFGSFSSNLGASGKLNMVLSECARLRHTLALVEKGWTDQRAESFLNGHQDTYHHGARSGTSRAS